MNFTETDIQFQQNKHYIPTHKEKESEAKSSVFLSPVI